MSLEIMAKIIHTLVFQMTMYRCKRWAAKKTDRKIIIIYLKYGVRGELYGHLGLPER